MFSIAEKMMIKSKQAASATKLPNSHHDEDGDILMMNSAYDQKHEVYSAAVSNSQMSSRGSADSIASSASSSSLYREPELSQSFGSTKSYDLFTPNKALQTSQAPYVSSVTAADYLSMQRQAAETGMDKIAQQSSSSLGLTFGNGPKPTEVRRAPGLAGRLQIALPPNRMLTDSPLTPGGHIATGARDGAINGAPVSPFEPPTPLMAPKDLPFSTSPVHRPCLPQRSSSARQIPLVMSPLTRELSSLGMRKTMSSKGSEAGSSHRSSNVSEVSTLLTPPFSPFVATKALPESELSSSAVQRSTSGGSSSSVNGTLSKSARTVSPRPKSTKTAKVSPYPSPSREEGISPIRESLGASAMIAAHSQPASGFFSSPPENISPQATSTPSLLRDVLKTPSSSATTPKALKMEKSYSEPVPRTVSGRHLANRSLHPVFARSYALGDELGSGGFGFVVSATRLSDGLPVAVKFIWKEKVPSHGWVRDDKFGAIPMEAFVLKVIDSPYVVKFVDLFADSEFFYLVMEHHGSPWKAPQTEEEEAAANAQIASSKLTLSPEAGTDGVDRAIAPSPTFAVFPPGCDTPLSQEIALSSSPTALSDTSGSELSSNTSATSSLRPAPLERRSSCDLFECIEQHSHLTEDRARWVFAQIVEAVYDLDKRGICHRDIKDENCVVDRDFNVKLIDFGSAVITDTRKPTPYFGRFFGTMTFASSEILQGKQYRAPHAEVWSLGVLLSILLSGECPFADPKAAIAGKITKTSKAFTAEVKDLMSQCLQVDPDRRATIRQVRDHPWVAKAWTQRQKMKPNSVGLA